MLVIVPSGSRYCFTGKCGTYFWGAHEHDAVWHLALVEVAFSSLPFRFPVLLGQQLGGYNYLLDFIIHIISLSGLSPSVIYFKILPVIWFGVFGYLLHQASRLIRPDRNFSRWAFFFVLFSTSFGVLIQWFKHNTLWGSVGIPTMQGALSMTNPQFMWSICVLLMIWIVVKKEKLIWTLGMLVFLGLGLKFYFIVPALIFICYYVLSLLVSKKIRSAMTVVLSVSIGLIAAYMIFYKGGAPGGLIWKPLEIPHQMIEDKNLWYDQIMVQQRYYIQQLGHMFSPRLWWIEAKTIFYFIFFNFGLRFFGVIGAALLMIFKRKSSQQLAPFLFTIVICTLMPIFFIQRGTWWNSIQFLYYGIFFASILAAEFAWQITHKRHVVFTIGVVIVCILFFIPTNLEVAQLFGSHTGAHYIPDDEVIALRELHKLPYGVVLTQPFSAKDTNILADSFDTAYVAAYGGKQVYLADKDQLQLLGVGYEKMQETLIEDPCSLLADVQYVYIRLQARDLKLNTCTNLSKEFHLVYKNRGVNLWARN